MRELTYNNSRKSMIPRDYTKSSNFVERNYSLLTGIFGSIAAFCIGSCIGWSSNAIDINSSKTFPLSLENMTTRQVAWIISIFTLGATISPIVVFKLWRFLGSKLLILIGSGFLITSWILLILYQSFITILCARLLAGFGVGCLHFIMPIYMQDLASIELRSTIDYIWHIHLASGIFIQFLSALSNSMQFVNTLFVIPPIILFIGFLLMPESPRYLCAKGNSNAAKEVLRKFREQGSDDVEQDLYLWCNRKLQTYSLRIIFKSSSNLRRLIPTFGLVILEQLNGLWAAFFYLSWIFRISDGEYSPVVTSIIISGIFLLSIILPKIFGLQYTNDKLILIWTNIFKSIALFIFGFYIHYQGIYGHLDDDYEYLPLLCYGIFVFLNGYGLYQITWKYTRTLVLKSQYLNIKCLTISISYGLLCILTRIIPRLIELVGIGWLFWFMGFLCLIITFFSILLIPNLNDLQTKYIFENDEDYSSGSSSCSADASSNCLQSNSSRACSTNNSNHSSNGNINLQNDIEGQTQN